MPDCPGSDERREGLSMPWEEGWTQTELKLETQGKMSYPDSDAWAALLSLRQEMKRKGKPVTAIAQKGLKGLKGHSCIE